nr:unnamed protein product [Callosobruchus analis]
MIGVPSGLVKKLKEKNPVSQRQALASKASSRAALCTLNSRLFTLLCEDLDSDQKALLFHTEVRWLPKATCWLAFMN